MIKLKDEPKYTFPLTKIDVIKSLNWYNQNVDINDALQFAIHYIKTEKNIDVSQTITRDYIVFGYIARMLSNGLVLPDDVITTFNKKYEQLLNIKEEKKPNSPAEKTKKQIDNTDLVIGEFEASIDNLILSKFEKNIKPDSVLVNRKHINFSTIVNYFQRKITEFKNVLTTDDEEYRYGYSNFTDSQLKKIISFCESIVIACTNPLSEKTKSRKNTKVKPKDVNKLLKNLKYCGSFPELNLKSIDPKLILKSQTLWVYNTKYKKLGYYHAKDCLGLSIYRSSIDNFDESISICKSIRKPADIIPQIISGGKVFLRNVLISINSKETPLTGRINEDTILLRAY